MRYFLVFFSLILFFAHCKKEVSAPVSLGKDYFPLSIDHWQTYEVDSIVVSDFTNPVSIDTFSYTIKETIVDTFLDLNEEKNFRIVEKKKYPNSSWFTNNVFSAKATEFNVQKVENDLRFVKIVFPVLNETSWDGHIFLDVQDEATLEYLDTDRYPWEFSYSEVNTAMEIGGFSFDSCVIVTQINQENLFEKKYSKEIYAKNVGLVFKELIVLETQAPPSADSFLDRAENGFILRYTISDYKK